MPTEVLKSYSEISAELKKKGRQKHLLLGNGFSRSYDDGIFSYNALSKFVREIDDKQLQQLFDIVNTNNFELLMQQLDNAAKIAEVFGASKKVVDRIKEASETLKTSLIEAIKALHPEHVFKIAEEKSQACAKFLSTFLNQDGLIFTTNYDLLLYWVLMRNELDKAGDGFGRDAEETDEWIEPEDRNLSDLYWGRNRDTQTVHYLHGALHIFDAGIEILKEQYTGEHMLLENVKARMENKEYPIFVTAGSGKDKLNHIVHNKYLAYCYEQLSLISGSLIVYGFGFGTYDDHIIKAINKAHKWRDDGTGTDKLTRLHSVYIGVYSDSDYNHIKQIEKQFKVPVRMFDATTINVWGE